MIKLHCVRMASIMAFFFFQAEDGIRDFCLSRGLGDVYKRQHAIWAYSIFFPIVEIVLATAIGLIVYQTSLEAGILKQSQQGTLMAFILCLNLIFRPLRVIADKFNVLQMGMVASERVFKVLDNEDHLQPSHVDAYKPSHIKGKIGFENVVFGYNPGNPVLKNVSFTVNPGETVAIVGHTGSGKPTIISLLNRLYHIQDGEIKIDDVNIEKYDIERLRKSVGVVLQDVFLFSGSIIDNITLCNADIPRENVIEAAKVIGM